MYTIEAATELLIRTGWIRPDVPWLELDPRDAERPWIDFEAIPDDIGAYSGGEQRVLRLAASIASDDVMVNLSDAVSGLDRHVLDLVLAALAHAGGSHEHGGVVYDDDGKPVGTRRYESLYPWPEETS